MIGLQERHRSGHYGEDELVRTNVESSVLGGASYLVSPTRMRGITVDRRWFGSPRTMRRPRLSR